MKMMRAEEEEENQQIMEQEPSNELPSSSSSSSSSSIIDVHDIEAPILNIPNEENQLIVRVNNVSSRDHENDITERIEDFSSAINRMMRIIRGRDTDSLEGEASKTEDVPLEIPNRFDYSGLEHSNFFKLGGKLEYFITFNILIYCGARELSKLSISCKFFAQATKASFLWNNLYKYDFMIDGDSDYNRLLTPTHNKNNVNNSTALSVSMRNQYIRRLADFDRRIKHYREEKKNLELEMKRLDRIKIVEVILDTIFIRIFVPLLLTCIILSIILYCQKMDGAIHIPIWGCMIPMGFMFIYLFLATLLMKFMHSKQYSTTSFFKGLWNYMRGPLIFVYQELLDESIFALRWFYGFLTFLILQIGMITVKLSWNVPRSFRQDFLWGIVFIPIWIFFFAFLISPCTKYRIDMGIYLILFTLIWIPLLIFFICLTAKLDQDHSIRIALMLIPFYIIEGSILITSTVVAIGAYYR
jgi:hypothetical protein